MDNQQRRLEDKKLMDRRISDQSLIHKFDLFVESRTSIVLNWLWKSGLFIFIITLVAQNLAVQKKNTEIISENVANINVLLKSNSETAALSAENTKDIVTIKTCIETQKADIKYLRRDVDGLMKDKGYPIAISKEGIDGYNNTN